ncbi:hypothetical protein ACFHYQ_00940 [Sphaerimonospora cavernae]|uniref:Tetratricopeptide repeat protein n=1 Tax=Sphaerimonospora cavernae TaxID=1740611 RepID=A0ABV6TXE1_9ACTN
MGAEERLERARELYEQAVFGGDVDATAAADRELDAIEADLALARGRIVHARFLHERTEDPRESALFQRAAELYQRLGDVRGEAEALFWIGTFHQVVRHDNETAVPAFVRSYELATQAGDKLTMSYAIRHLGIAEHVAGRLDTARERLEESVQLRRELGFSAGVAMNLIGLAHIAVADGRADEVPELLREAESLAEASDAPGVLRWVGEARARLTR